MGVPMIARRQIISRTPRHLHWPFGQIGKAFVEILLHQLAAVFEFGSRELPFLWYGVPVLQARATATSCGMLGIKDGVAAHGCLPAIAGRVGGCQIFRKLVSRGFLQLETAFALRMALRH